MGGLGPVDLLAAYDIQKLRDQGIDGRGQTVVFWEIDALIPHCTLWQQRTSPIHRFTM